MENETLIFIVEYFIPLNSNKITGGYEKRYFDILKNLQKYYKIIVLTTKQENQKNFERYRNIEIYRISYSSYSHNGNLIQRFKFIRDIYFKGNKILQNKKLYKIIGCNFTTYSSSFFLSKKLKTELVYEYHEVWLFDWIKNKGFFGVFGFALEYLSLFLNKNGKFISVSKFTKNKLIKFGIKEKNIEIVYNPIKIEKSLKNLEKNNFNIFTISRHIKTKNIDVVIKAIYLLKNRIKNIKLIIGGKGEDTKRLQNLVKNLGLEKNVKFVGFINEKQKNNYFSKSNLFISASTVEGFGITLIESMSKKVPIICSNIEVFKEINIEGKTGFFFKQKNEKDLSEKILKYYYMSEKDKKKIQENCLKNVKKFEIKNIINKYRKVLK